MNRLTWIGVVAALAGVACGGGSAPAAEETVTETEQTSGTEVVAERVEEPPPPPPAPARARVIHAAGGLATTGVTGTAGDTSLGEVAYKAASAYTDVAQVAPINIAVMSATATAEGLTAGAPATFVVLSEAATPANVQVLPLVDEAQTVMGQQRGRVVNALLGAASIDVCAPGESARDAGRPIFSNIEYGQVGGIPAFPSRYQPMTLAGAVRVQIRQHAESSCSGRVIGTAEIPAIDANSAHNLTFVVVGRASGRPAVARELLICQDAPGDGSCAAVPLR